MQDSNTSRMTHNVYELIEYATNILTLSPGDIISGGSPAGTNIERAEPRWMKARHGGLHHRRHWISDPSDRERISLVSRARSSVREQTRPSPRRWSPVQD